ncbi:MAG: squalene/phytoene synthase family protein [Proteobacteria bacterium]|nr:squalene/phytoene synthase family protein [Pseudomonadota bacterium]
MMKINYTSLQENLIINQHYENFPIARFLSRELRHAVATVYAFARIGDDLADEGASSKTHRQSLLQQMKSQLERIKTDGHPNIPLFQDLQKIIRQFNLNTQYFDDLLDAFLQDTKKKSYLNEKELDAYYQKAAHSAGRIYLQINHLDQPMNRQYSDCICNAFARIDMLQDIQEDFKKNRVYLPIALQKKFKLKLTHDQFDQFNPNWHAFKHYWTKKIEQKLILGKGIMHTPSVRFNLQMRVLVATGLHLNQKLKKSKNPFKNNKMTLVDWGVVLIKGMIIK